VAWVEEDAMVDPKELAGRCVARTRPCARAGRRLRGGAAPGGHGYLHRLFGEAGRARVRQAYPGSTWDRLAAIKRRYDPGNPFRPNQNIL
jgi:hypothetical protein